MSTVPYINSSSEKEKKNYKRDRIESTMKREHIFNQVYRDQDHDLYIKLPFELSLLNCKDR
jgi:hypothetical protein